MCSLSRYATRLLAATALLGFAANSLHAATILGSLNSTGATAAEFFGPNEFVANQFTITGQSWTLTSLDLVLSNVSTSPGPSWNLYISNDSAGNPGSTVVAGFGAPNNTTTPLLGGTVWNAPVISSPVLAPGTYWLVVGAPGGGSFEWRYIDPSGGTANQENTSNSVNDLYAFNTGLGFGASTSRRPGNDFHLFRLNGDPVPLDNGVPEPSMVVLGGLTLSLGVLVQYARRRNRVPAELGSSQP